MTVLLNGWAMLADIAPSPQRPPISSSPSLLLMGVGAVVIVLLGFFIFGSKRNADK